MSFVLNFYGRIGNSDNCMQFEAESKASLTKEQVIAAANQGELSLLESQFFQRDLESRRDAQLEERLKEFDEEVSENKLFFSNVILRRENHILQKLKGHSLQKTPPRKFILRRSHSKNLIGYNLQNLSCKSKVHIGAQWDPMISRNFMQNANSTNAPPLVQHSDQPLPNLPETCQ